MVSNPATIGWILGESQRPPGISAACTPNGGLPTLSQVSATMAPSPHPRGGTDDDAPLPPTT